MHRELVGCSRAKYGCEASLAALQASPYKQFLVACVILMCAWVLLSSQSRPVPSLLRSYSAPVKMHVEGQTDEDLVFLLAHDTGEGKG